MYSIEPWETDLTPEPLGQASEGTDRRIAWLVNHVLAHVADREGGYDSLYQDPADGRYWQLEHPFSEMHGGGPYYFRVINEEAARRLYSL